jgi:hypothetical protein
MVETKPLRLPQSAHAKVGRLAECDKTAAFDAVNRMA